MRSGSVVDARGEKILGFSEDYALGRIALDGQARFLNGPYGSLWMLSKEFEIALEKGDYAQAESALRAFAFLASHKIKNGERSSVMSFSLIQVGRALEKKRHFLNGRPGEIMAKLLRLVESIPSAQWDGPRQLSLSSF